MILPAVGPIISQMLPHGAIHRWDFSVQSGTTLPDVVGGLDGTLSGSPLPSWSGGGLRFPSGSSSVVTLPSTSSAAAISGVPSGVLTFCARIAWDPTVTGVPRVFVRANWQYQVFFTSLGKIAFYDGATKTTTSTIGFSGDQVIGWEATEGELFDAFVDGVPDGTSVDTCDLFPISVSTGLIGNLHTGLGPLCGTLKELAVWDRDLSDAEHAAVAALWS